MSQYVRVCEYVCTWVSSCDYVLFMLLRGGVRIKYSFRIFVCQLMPNKYHVLKKYKGLEYPFFFFLPCSFYRLNRGKIRWRTWEEVVLQVQFLPHLLSPAGLREYLESRTWVWWSWIYLSLGLYPWDGIICFHWICVSVGRKKIIRNLNGSKNIGHTLYNT